MKGVLRKIPVHDRYQYIRRAYQKLNQNFPLTVNHVLDKKLKDEHLFYIHSGSNTNPMISGQLLAEKIKQLVELDVSRRSINRNPNEIGQQFRPPIRSVFISPTATQKRFNFALKQKLTLKMWYL